MSNFGPLDEPDIVVFVKDGKVEGLHAAVNKPLNVRYVTLNGSEAFVGNSPTDPYSEMAFELKALLGMDYFVSLREQAKEQST